MKERGVKRILTFSGGMACDWQVHWQLRFAEINKTSQWLLCGASVLAAISYTEGTAVVRCLYESPAGQSG
jgi:hypothetical protein